LSDPIRLVARLGSRLSSFADRWDLSGGGALVRAGLQPRWLSTPRTPSDLSRLDRLPPHLHRLLSDSVQKELLDRVIVEISLRQALCISPIFFVPKPDGTFRKIIDTSALNFHPCLPDSSFAASLDI
jgi:hypothetical protein